MTDLQYVPQEEFNRFLDHTSDPILKTALLADLARINTLYMIARAGSGHIGSSFSSLDIVAWLFLNGIRRPAAGETGHEDLYFSSKGHDAPGLYAVLTGLGLLDFKLIHGLRRLGGLPGHPDVSVPYLPTNTGSLGMGISKAKGLALARRIKGESSRIYVLTGDGELQEGQFWESLHSLVNHNFGEITVIIDHNKIQSDTLVSRVSDLGDLEKKLTAFGVRARRVDGHDPAALADALKPEILEAGPPLVIVADTVKGKGVSFMEGTSLETGALYQFHSGAPSPEDYESALAELKARVNARLAETGRGELHLESEPRQAAAGLKTPQRLIEAYSRELLKQAEQNPALTVLDADLIKDCGLLAFAEKYPDRFFECGIAEQDMVSMAGGLALAGLLPLVHSFACFLSTRPNEQIYNNATERKKILYAASLAGLLPGGPGHSHQSVRDIAALSGVPGLVMIQPANEAETALALDYCLNQLKDSTYLRLTTIPVEVPFRLPEDYTLSLGRGVEVRPGSHGAIISYGPVMLSQAFEAAEILAGRDGIQLKVINLPWLNRVDPDWLKVMVAGLRIVFTLDDHYLEGGQGRMIASVLAAQPGENRPVWRGFGVEDIPACGRNDEVLKAHGLDAGSLADKMAETLKSL